MPASLVANFLVENSMLNFKNVFSCAIHSSSTANFPKETKHNYNELKLNLN
jgi:hypothetical protein